MTRRAAGIVPSLACLTALGLLAVPGPTALARASDKPISLQGRWTLDRDHSQLPDDVGFDVVVDAVGSSPQNANPSTNRTRNTGRSSGGSGLALAREDEQTLRILADLTDEAQHPWAVVLIDQTPDAVTIGDGASQSRKFIPGHDSEQRLADGGITTRAKWDKAALVVDYTLEKGRVVRYTYSRSSETAPLEVDVSFRDHGKGDVLKRLYQR